MVQKYYVSTSMKLLLITVAFTVLFINTLILFMSKYTSIEIAGDMIFFVVSNVVTISIVGWRIRTPVLELSQQGLKLNIPFLFKTQFARWDEIEGIVEGETSTLGIKDKNIKILLKTGEGASNEMVLSLKAVNEPDKIVRELKEKVPEPSHDKIRRSGILQTVADKTSVTYRRWTLTKEGIETANKRVPWEQIKSIKSPGLVIAGYGPVMITYTHTDGKEMNISVKPQLSSGYQDFLKYLVLHSEQAAIDSGIIKALEYSPGEAKADLFSILLFLSGFTLCFIFMSMMNYYAPTVDASYYYPLLLFPFALFPQFMTVKLLAGRFRGMSEPGSKKLQWASTGIIGAFFALAIFFMISPFSFYWFIGDIHKKAGDIEATESYYQKAVEIYPESIDIPYEMGKLYREKEEWEEAFKYLKKAYTQDPTYWGPMAVILLPDTLMKMGRYDEALQWCKQILEDRPNKIDIAKAINKKQNEILRERDMHTASSLPFSPEAADKDSR